MPKQVIIAEQHRIAAVFSEDQIQELVVATGSHQIGDIFLGTVENVLPGIDAAFVNIGDAERNGFIHVTDLGPLRLKRSAASITELLIPQQKVLVQVMKEPTGNKGPRLTGNVTLPGRYLVLMPYGRGVSLSRRIRNENERSHLRALAILIKPSGMGLLVRTEAEGVSEEAIIEDLETLLKQWESILQEASTTRAPALLNRDDDFIQRVLRDFYSADVNRIVVDSHTGMKRVKQYITSWNGGKPPSSVLVDQHGSPDSSTRESSAPILEYFRINAAIREALKPRVDLPSGGYIIIERTEALTVIDVNSGSFTKSATARETVLWTNFEAAIEIARQLRLRNIAGVVIVDFIDMDSHRDKLQVLEHFNRALRADKARPQIAQLSELGLVELTRKRQGQNIYELFSRPCPSCGGLGHLIHLPGETIRDGNLAAQAIPLEARSSELRSRDREAREPRESQLGSRRGRVRGPVPVGFEELETPLSEADTVDSLPFARDFSWPGQTDEDALDSGSPSDPDMLGAGYADRSGAGNRRRRRRRSEGGGRPERDRQDRERQDNRQDNGRRHREISGREADFSAGSSEQSSTLETMAPFLKEPRRSSSSDSSGREGAPERSDRRSHRPSHPTEIISVTMTAEEQDVYALMGISPLALIDRDLKDARSAIISVVLPGEDEVDPPNGTQLEIDGIEEDDSDLTVEEFADEDFAEVSADDDPEDESDELEAEDSDDFEDAAADEVKSVSVPKPLPIPSSSRLEIVAIEPADDLTDPTGGRRRRRRSSASSSDTNG